MMEKLSKYFKYLGHGYVQSFTYFQKVWIISTVLVTLLLNIFLNAHTELQILSIFMGLTFQINVSLIAFRRISNWFFGLITVILSGIYFLHTGLNGTAILYLFFYIPMNIAGFFMWIKRSDKIKLDEVVPMKISREGFISFIISIAILAVFSYLLIYYQVSIDFLTTGHYLDFLSVLFGIFGQVFTNMASALQWIPWVFVNGIIVIVYATQVNLSMVALFTIALANAIIGLRFWLRKD